MAFMNNNGGFNNSNNNNGGDKKKVNFRVGRVYGEDGILDISIWNSDKGGTYAVMSIKAAIGKDPSTGMNAYEQKMSGELPSCFMNTENVCAVIMAMEKQNPENVKIDLNFGRSSLKMIGSGDTYKIVIDNQKNGSRTITMKAIQVNDSDKMHASYRIILEHLKLCYKKSLRAKVDAEEFATALAGESTQDDETTPF